MARTVTVEASGVYFVRTQEPDDRWAKERVTWLEAGTSVPHVVGLWKMQVSEIYADRLG
jgi:hypothetical protein